MGFAVLDGPTLPIIADGDQEPNDTYMEQLIAGAKAAVQVCSHPVEWVLGENGQSGWS